MQREKKSDDAGVRPDQLVERARAAGDRLREIAEEMTACAAQRHAVVRALRDRFGWSHQQVADALHISRGQAQSLYEARSGGGRPARDGRQDSE